MPQKSPSSGKAGAAEARTAGAARRERAGERDDPGGPGQAGDRAHDGVGGQGDARDARQAHRQRHEGVPAQGVDRASGDDHVEGQARGVAGVEDPAHGVEVVNGVVGLGEGVWCIDELRADGQHEGGRYDPQAEVLDRAACGGPVAGRPPADGGGSGGSIGGFLRGRLLRSDGPVRIARGAVVAGVLGGGSCPAGDEDPGQAVRRPHGDGGQDDDGGCARHDRHPPGQSQPGRQEAGPRDDGDGQGRSQGHHNPDGQAGCDGDEAAGGIQQSRCDEQRVEESAPHGHGGPFGLTARPLALRERGSSNPAGADGMGRMR